MKKLFAMMLVLVMIFAFVACGEEAETAGGENAAEITGEVYDAGNVQIMAPSGWKAFGYSDMFSDEEGAMDPDAAAVCKGGETDFDLFTKPYIRVDYYGPETDMMAPSKDFYDNVEDIEPLTAGKYTWTGFTCESFGSVMALLWAEDGDHQYQVSIILEGSEGDSISLNDADVQAILASIAPSAA